MVKVYRKKPVHVEAMQWDGSPKSAENIIGWIRTRGGNAKYNEATPPYLHSVRCRCDGRGIVPGPNSHAVRCPETEPKGSGEPAYIHIIDANNMMMDVLEGEYVTVGVSNRVEVWGPDLFNEKYEPITRSDV